jgi:hypothetical protein
MERLGTQNRNKAERLALIVTMYVRPDRKMHDKRKKGFPIHITDAVRRLFAILEGLVGENCMMTYCN